MNSYAEVFEAVKEHCRVAVVDASFKLFIEPLELKCIEENTAIIYANNEWAKNVVEERFSGAIRKGFEKILGFTIIPKFEVKKEDSPTAEPINGGHYALTFETFIVGSSNKFAHAAALAVAQNPARAYNPLFIYGESGLGKTHLLKAIQYEIARNKPNAQIIYVDGETFTNEIVNAIKENNTKAFHDKYRQIDVLLVDDIQFIAGKQQTQEEFFHTFNALHEAKKQIVLTSDRPPREMTLLENRLQTRFESGLMVDVAPPDFETRLAIIKMKAGLLGVKLPDDITSYIAENVTANVRQIEGTLNKILAYRDLLGDKVDEEAVGRAVRDMLIKSNEYIPSAQAITEYVCKYFNLDPEVLRGQSRSRDVVNARQIAMYLIRRMTNLSQGDIGKEFGGRDHTTVLHSLDKVEKQMRSDPAFAEEVKAITTNINSKK